MTFQYKNFLFGDLVAILIVSRLTIKTSGYSCFIFVVKLFEQFLIKCHYSECSGIRHRGSYNYKCAPGKGDSVSVIVDTERLL